jgi:hypothetical protein
MFNVNIPFSAGTFICRELSPHEEMQIKEAALVQSTGAARIIQLFRLSNLSQACYAMRRLRKPNTARPPRDVPISAIGAGSGVV